VRRLFHFTCAHSVNGIRRTNRLEPNVHPLLGRLALVWLTDMEEPDIYGLGLTSHLIRCRRTEYRVSVDTEALHWPDLARTLRRTTSDRQVLAGVESLESATGARPMHWWVSLASVPVVELEAVA
jgi:hypothetical protein